MPGAPPVDRGTARSRGVSPTRRAWARAVAIIAILLAAVILLHPLIPGPIGTAIATVLPWLGFLVPVLALVALLTRRRRAWLVVGVPLLAWMLIVVPQLVPLAGASASESADGTLTVASQNVQAGSGTAGDSARTLIERGADVIALVELDGAAREAANEALADSHPYSYAAGTVGVWSVYPIANEQPLDLGLGWRRALAVDVETPAGLVSVYVVHAASVRPGVQGDRDTMLAELSDTVERDENERVLVMGDFNAASTDPALTALRREVSEPNQSDLSLGFTWPAENPLVRIDHIFQAGLKPLENEVFAAGASDHLALLARFAL